MQVEVKLRLADAAAHDKVVELLKADQQHLYRQQNLFYDGPNKELSSQRTVLRVRWFNGDEKVVITVKGKMKVQDGVGRAEENEDEVDVATAEKFEQDPSSILKVDLPVIHTLKSCAEHISMPDISVKQQFLAALCRRRARLRIPPICERCHAVQVLARKIRRHVQTACICVLQEHQGRSACTSWWLRECAQSHLVARRDAGSGRDQV